MLDQLVRRLYERLGARYKLVFFATQIPASVLVALMVVAIVASYYRPSTGEVLLIAATTSAFTALGVAYSILRQRPALVDMARWRDMESADLEETVAAWDAAANFPMRSYRRNSLATNAIAAIPSVVVMVFVLDLPISAFPVLLAAGGIAAAYGTALTYAIAEYLVRPAIAEIATALPEDFRFTRNGLPVRKRLMLTLPTFTATAGLMVAALVTHEGGTRMLAISVVVSVVVALGLSHELTVLLSRSITEPLTDLRAALARVGDGDYTARVPVMSSDDLGELSAAFNHMASGLAERERLREAFGTYLDKDVARLVLSEQYPAGGVEVQVTIMFCDVPGFTPYAEAAPPGEVVAALNAMFERLVPIITRHGGHVDKFLGDGVLAVFGAPEGYDDHADRALAAGLEILDVVNAVPDGLKVGVGLNTGRVVAGSIGGAGRLNFSVIGDAVNVAARVEAATRDFDDDLLITATTRDALTRPGAVAALVSRGSIALKGKSEPVELLAPIGRSAPGIESDHGFDGSGIRRGGRPGATHR